MNYQAGYFKADPEVPEAHYADNVVYAYNEAIKLCVEIGLPGLMLALILLVSLFFTQTNDPNNKSSVWAARTGLVAVVIFGLFAYPSEILPIKMGFVFGLHTQLEFKKSDASN